MTWNPIWNPPCGFPGRPWRRADRVRPRSPKSRLRKIGRTFKLRGWIDRRGLHAMFIVAKLRAWRPSKSPPTQESK